MAMSSFQFKTATTAIASQSSVILLIFVDSTITNAFQTVRTLQFYWLEQIHRMNQLYKEELLLRIAMFICYFVFETERIPLLIRLTIMLLTEAESKLSATNRFFLCLFAEFQFITLKNGLPIVLIGKAKISKRQPLFLF